jgi:peptidoglycan hydrolase CwlO-like protein
MSNKVNFLAATIAVVLASGVSHAASSTDKGSSPNGKPFVEINSQIVEVQGDVATLEEKVETLIGDVDSLEARMTAAEGAITDLNNTKTSLEAQINDLYAKAEASGVNITDLQNQLATLQTQLTALETQGSTNTTEINNLKAQIDAINSQIATNADGLAGLQAQLASVMDQIALLQSQIDIMNAEIATKQKIVSGQCNAGEFVRKVNADGSVVCGSDQQGVSGHWETVTVNSVQHLPGGQWVRYNYQCGWWLTCSAQYYQYPNAVTVQQACPTGFVVSGGNYSNAGGNFYVYSQRSVLGLTNAYQVTAVSTGYGNTSGADIALQASCSRIVP